MFENPGEGARPPPAPRCQHPWKLEKVVRFGQNQNLASPKHGHMADCISV